MNNGGQDRPPADRQVAPDRGATCRLGTEVLRFLADQDTGAGASDS
ncbi:hypothetical protein SAMN05444716_10716 [Streptomyces harbinensis]|uniref:Uncharacterized protein n=1 Tax=Streptomyces harbinensis TaxID=1176198 RepID=A0A1I6V2J3_9ACTN|nr:hypothetical protein SAMN05444716_10716 [Streptomyces harbinensis]